MNDTEWKMKYYNKQIAFTHLCAHMLYVVSCDTLYFCRNDRYDDLRACLGEGLLQQLQQQQLFMVGAD